MATPVFKTVARTQPITAKASNAFATRREKSTIRAPRLAVAQAISIGMAINVRVHMDRVGTAVRRRASSPILNAMRLGGNTP
jgi:hypothetical protein